MENMQFVTCNETTCPFNEGRECRASFLMIDSNGKCVIKDKGPFDGKAVTQNYVDIRECRCKVCNHWEKDELTEIGQCGLRDSLHFNQRKVDPNQPTGPSQAACSTFEQQVEQPENFPRQIVE